MNLSDIKTSNTTPLAFKQGVQYRGTANVDPRISLGGCSTIKVQSQN